jgi:branched-chain amino acid transport system permease protein
MATATGIYHRSYQAELRLHHTRAEYARLGLTLLFVLALPFVVAPYWLGVVNTVLIAVIGALGLNILVGYTGQISLGQGGFLAVGAYTSAVLTASAGLPVPVSIACAVALTAAVGAFFGIPALRLKGLYLAIATLAAQLVIVFVVRRWKWLTDGKGFIDVPRLEIAGFRVERSQFDWQWYWILLPITALCLLGARNLFRTAIGRAFMAVRDQDIAAATIGINVTRTKVFAFAVSSGFVGLAGALTAHYTETVTWERFTLDISISYLAMILVGGLGSIAGTVYGAAFITMLPPLLTELSSGVRDVMPFLANQLPAIQNAVFGLVIIIFLLIEPRGLNHIWSRVKAYVRVWPFRY